MDAALLPCYRCGKVPTVDPNGGYPTVSCDACYSGPPDFCASGMNTAQAVADWNERMEMEEPFVAKEPECLHYNSLGESHRPNCPELLRGVR